VDRAAIGRTDGTNHEGERNRGVPRNTDEMIHKPDRVSIDSRVQDKIFRKGDWVLSVMWVCSTSASENELLSVSVHLGRDG